MCVCVHSRVYSCDIFLLGLFIIIVVLLLDHSGVFHSLSVHLSMQDTGLKRSFTLDCCIRPMGQSFLKKDFLCLMERWALIILPTQGHAVNLRHVSEFVRISIFVIYWLFYSVLWGEAQSLLSYWHYCKVPCPTPSDWWLCKLSFVRGDCPNHVEMTFLRTAVWGGAAPFVLFLTVEIELGHQTLSTVTSSRLTLLPD